MAAVVRNNVWVAPGQDAQFLHKTAAPLTADCLRGEDHGQVLCNTRDAIPETSSFHDYSLVGVCVFLLFAPHRASQCLLAPAGFYVEGLYVADQRKISLFSSLDANLTSEAGLCAHSLLY